MRSVASKPPRISEQPLNDRELFAPYNLPVQYKYRFACGLAHVYSCLSDWWQYALLFLTFQQHGLSLFALCPQWGSEMINLATSQQDFTVWPSAKFSCDCRCLRNGQRKRRITTERFYCSDFFLNSVSLNDVLQVWKSPWNICLHFQIVRNVKTWTS